MVCMQTLNQVNDLDTKSLDAPFEAKWQAALSHPGSCLRKNQKSQRPLTGILRIEKDQTLFPFFWLLGCICDYQLAL